MTLHVKRLNVVLSEEAARLVRDSLLDSADFVEDAITNGEATGVVKELRGLGRAIEGALLMPATPAEYEEIRGVPNAS